MLQENCGAIPPKESFYFLSSFSPPDFKKENATVQHSILDSGLALLGKHFPTAALVTFCATSFFAVGEAVL